MKRLSILLILLCGCSPGLRDDTCGPEDDVRVVFGITKAPVGTGDADMTGFRYLTYDHVLGSWSGELGGEAVRSGGPQGPFLPADASRVYWPEGRTYSFYAAGYNDLVAVGEGDAEFGSAYTIYSSGDVTIDYTITAPDGSKCTLPAMVGLLNAHDDQVLRWYGQERRTLINNAPWHSPTICSLPMSKFPVGDERNDVRWLVLTDTTLGSSVFACITDTTATMRHTHDRLVLVPHGDQFRLHLKAGMSADSLAELCATEAYRMPTVSSGIPKPPVITADAPRFAQPLKVTIVQAAGQQGSQATIRYTLDGSEPDESSPIYKEPFTLDKTTIVKARVFEKDMPPSFTATRKFNYDYILRTTFSRKPNTPYNVGADTLLFDGDRGTADNLSFGWLGFSGGDLTTTVELAKPLDVESVTLRYAHNPALWAFAPQRVTITFSTDGQNFTDTVQTTIPFDPMEQDQAEARVVELKVPATADGVGFIRIEAQTISNVPSWHRAKGLNPWLMMDEIEINEKVRKIEN